MDIRLENTQNELIRILTILSAKKEEQSSYLKKIGTYPSCEELALEYYDIYIVVSFKTNPLNLSNDSLEQLKIINDVLDKISGPENEKFWIVDFLENEPWNEIRSLAEEVLLNLKT